MTDDTVTIAIGAGVGGLVVAAALIVLIACLIKRRNIRSKARKQEEEDSSAMPPRQRTADDPNANTTYVGLQTPDKIEMTVMRPNIELERRDSEQTFGSASRSGTLRGIGTPIQTSAERLLEQERGLNRSGSGGMLHPWQIREKDIVILNKMGSGAYGAVFRGKWRNQSVAGEFGLINCWLVTNGLVKKLQGTFNAKQLEGFMVRRIALKVIDKHSG